MIPSIELQRAIYEQLNSGLYPVYETVPSDTTDLPLITMQDFNRQTNFTKTNQDRFTYSVMLHGWSVGRSSIQSKEIEEHIYQTVMSLAMMNYDVEMVRLAMNGNMRDEENKDAIVFHSIQQFEITIQRKGE